MANQQPLPAPRPNVPIRADDESTERFSHGERFDSNEVLLSRLGGGTQVHVNQLTIQPGKQSGPYHYHVREEEHFYVLTGRCVLRSGEDRHDMTQGDYVCFPANGRVAHAFENPFAEECTLLTIGAFDPDEVAVYPDSGKAKIRALNAMVKWPQESLEYWDGEDAQRPVERDR